ncbi:MAG: acetyl-CoA carboxylase carboxyl transferase subunit alpha [Christensenellaceae bacterium]|nr:acetyl-CoA carboxylase carboxyl transferase subunit alpha [Christensenellaceae bacterium]
MTAYEKVCAARSEDRPTALSYIKNIFTDFFELHGDRAFADDPAIVAGLARLGGMPVTVIALERGTDAKDRAARNSGCAHPEGYRKALRLMKQAEKFHRPVVCLVDTAGAYCGVGAEERGQAQAIAMGLMEMMDLKVPTVSILIGQGISAGALALAVADRVWMLENAVFSPILPEDAAELVWEDASRAEEASEALKLTAQDLKEMGIVDCIFAEPEAPQTQEEEAAEEEDEPADPFAPMYAQLKAALLEQFAASFALSDEERIRLRREKFRSIGTPT